MPNDNQISYFNLNGDGASSVVRLLHTSTKTIETAKVHNIMVNQKRKTVKCCGEGCPLCASKLPSYDRIFIHLIDYADGKEKVWSRTPTILKQLEELETSWGDLSALVLKITRVGNEFPKYNIMMMPPQTFPPINRELVDVKISYRFYMHRSAEELSQFLTTGVMPTHESKSFMSKEEYFKALEKSGGAQPTPNAVPPSYASQSPQYATYAPYTAPTQQQYGYFAQSPQPQSPPQVIPSTPLPMGAYQQRTAFDAGAETSYGFVAPPTSQTPTNPTFADPFGPFTRKA